MMVPDQIYDWANLVSDPSLSNGIHTALDYPDLIGKIIPGKKDDIILKGLNIVSNIDDAASAAGKDIFSFNTDRTKRREQRPDSTPIAVESTRVNVPN